MKSARSRMTVAFAAVYLIWGSSYLAIRFAIETLPPLTMAGARYVVAGLVLLAWTRARGLPAPRRAHWPAAFVVGGAMLLLGNGGVVWAEQRVPSGLAALFIATVPLWMALLEWLRGEAARPSGRIALGLALGLGGVALLVGFGGTADGRRVDPLGAAVLVGAALAWAAGSLHSRRARLPESLLVATGLEMLAGGILLVLAGAARGEWARMVWSAISLRSLLALAYLCVFASLVAFTAYVWLLHHTTATRVATYAFVNPIIAVLLGWSLGGEALGARACIAAAVVIAGVVLLVTARIRPREAPAPDGVPAARAAAGRWAAAAAESAPD